MQSFVTVWKRFAESVSVVAFAAMFAGFVIGVGGRYLFNEPVAWSNELCAIGFVWIVLWSIYYDTPARQKRLGAAELAYINSDPEPAPEPAAEGAKVPWFKLLGYRQTWAFAVGKFLTDGIWWFYLFWLPTYLSSQYGMSATDIALPLAVLYSMTMVGSIGGGWFPAFFMNRGYAPFDGRMRAMLVIAFFPLAVLLAHLSWQVLERRVLEWKRPLETAIRNRLPARATAGQT